MPKTKESIAAYNKEYFARPEVIARAKVRNAQYRERRAEYKKTEAGQAAERKWRTSEANKLREKRNRLSARYGLTHEQLQIMFENQNKQCAICKREIPTFHIDHDHETNKVRGLLCSQCNMALGLMKDDTTILSSAIEYLNAI